MQARSGAAGQSISLNLPATLNYPFTIDVQVQVNDGATTQSSTLRYVINAPTPDIINGYLNQEYAVTSLPVATDPAILMAPTFSAPVLTASFVDENGIGVTPGSGDKGLLTMSTSSSGFHIVIDSLDSAQTGNIAQNILGSNLDFSTFFGLNDLFTRSDSVANWNNTKNTAAFLKIRDDIAQNSGYLSHGKLTQVVDYLGGTPNTYLYQITDGDNRVVLDMLNLANQNMFFSAKGGLPAAQTTIAKYTASIFGHSAAHARNAEVLSQQSQIVRQALYDNIRNGRGVDVNEEMASILLYQQSFSASARAVQMVKEMMDMLLEVL